MLLHLKTDDGVYIFFYLLVSQQLLVVLMHRQNEAAGPCYL